MSPNRFQRGRTASRAGLLAYVLISTVLGGCVATPGGPGGETDARQTTTATDPATATTSPVHPLSAAERAIAAERDRITRLNASYPRVQGLGTGILRGTEWKLLERNATGVILRVEVGYSVELDCNQSVAGPEQAVDGAATTTRYFVTDSEVSLLSVETTFVDPADYCE